MPKAVQFQTIFGIYVFFVRYNQLLFIIFFVYLFKSRHRALYHFPQNLSELFWKFSLIIIFFIFSTLALMFFIIPYVLHLYNSHRTFYCNSNIIVIITAQLEANILTTSFSCIHNITKTYMHLQYHFHQYLIVLTLPYTYYKSL